MNETAAEEMPIVSLAAIVKRAVHHETGLAQDHDKVLVECCYETFRVNVREAAIRREEFVRLLAQFGDTFSDESLKRGVAYERVRGLVQEDKLSMLEIFAFGAALEIWSLVTPKEKRRNPALRRIDFQGAEVGSIGIVRL